MFFVITFGAMNMEYVQLELGDVKQILALCPNIVIMDVFS